MKEKNNKIDGYVLPEQDWWHGRNDGDLPKQLRWWQHILVKSLDEKFLDFKNNPVLIGFKCDEGVARNKGRIGSAQGPNILRKALANLPIHNPMLSLFDAGNINCNDALLEKAQTDLSKAVKIILQHNGFPILLGGGHEILYGHFTGTSNHYDKKKVGIINFDAHFDNRKPENNSVSSGTGFHQIAEDCKNENKDFLYLAIGIQKSANTAALFKRAKNSKTDYILADDFHAINLEEIKKQVQLFLNKTDVICLTIDLDVFCASIVPGVSAPAVTGIQYDYTFREIIKLLAKSDKIVSLDIAEFNPKYDIDSHTAKLAAQLIFDWINWKFK